MITECVEHIDVDGDVGKTETGVEAGKKGSVLWQFLKVRE